MKKRILRRWVFGMLGFVLLSSLSLQFLFLFFADEVFKKSILMAFDRYVSQKYPEAKTLPSLDFGEFQLNLLSGKLTITQLVFKHYPSVQIAETDPTWEISMPKVEIDGINFWEIYHKKILDLKTIHLSKPSFEWVKKYASDSAEHPTHTQLPEDAIYTAVQEHLNAFSFDRLTLEDARWRVLFQDSLQSTAHQISTTSFQSLTRQLNLTVFQFQLDSTTKNDTTRVFFAENLDVQMRDYQMMFPDSSYLFHADTLTYSSQDQEVLLHQVALVPVKAATSETEQYFHVRVPLIALTQVDLSKIYFDKRLQIEHFRLQDPFIKIYGNFDRVHSPEISSLGIRKLHPDSLAYHLAQQVNALSVNYFTLERGQLQVYDHKDDTSDLLHIRDLALTFHDFLLEGSHPSDPENAQSNVLPMDSIQLELTGLSMKMPDRMHVLESSFMRLTTDRTRRYQCNLYFDDVHIKSKTGSLQQMFPEADSVLLGYDIAVEQVKFYDIDLEDLSARKMLFLDSISFSKPAITIANFSGIPFGELADENHKLEATQPKSVREILYDWSQARLNFHPIVAPGRSTALFSGVYVDYIKIDSGQLQLLSADLQKQTFDPVVSLQSFSAFIQQARIDNMGGSIFAMRKGYRDSRVAVYAKDLDIAVQQGEFRLPTDGGPTSDGMLQFVRAQLSTARSEGFVEGLSIQPNRAAVAFARNQIRHISLPHIKLSGIDFYRFYNQQQAEIKRLSISSPSIHLAIDEHQNPQPSKQTEISVENLFQWIIPYLNSLSLQRLDVADARVEVEKRNADQHHFHDFFTARQLSLNVYDFYIDSTIQITQKKPLYARDARLILKDYQFEFPGDSASDFSSVEGKTFAFSTFDNQLHIKHLRVNPFTDSTETHFSCQIEAIELDDVHLYEYLKFDQLLLQRLKVRQPQGKISVKPKKLREGSNRRKGRAQQPDLYPYIRKYVTQLKVDALSVEEGMVELIVLGEDTTHYFLADTVFLSTKNILIDPVIRREKKMWYADEVDFKIHVREYFSNIPKAYQRVEASNITISHRDAQFLAEKVSLIPLLQAGLRPGNEPPALYQMSVPAIQMQGVDFEKAYMQGDWVAKELSFHQPQIQLFTHTGTQEDTDQKSLKALLGPYVRSVKIDRIHLRNGSLKVSPLSHTGNPLFSIQHIDGSLHRFYIHQELLETLGNPDTGLAKPARNLWFADDIVLQLKDYQWRMQDSLLVAKAAEIGLSTKKSNLTVKSFELVPRFENEEIPAYFPYQKTWASGRIPLITIQHIDFEKLVGEHAFEAGVVNIQSPHFVLFRDKRLPRDLSRQPPMLQEMLLDLKLPVKVDTVSVFDGFVSYGEQVEGADRSGTITFEKFNATLHQATNYPDLVEQNVMLSLDANTYLMGQALLQVNLRFPMGTSDGPFSVTGSLGSMDLTYLNAMLEPTAFVHIKKGYSHGMHFQFVGNKEKSSGTMQFNYNDLSILLVDKQTGASGLDERVGSFLANAFVVKSDNPKAVFLRLGRIAYERDPSLSVFNYWWRSLLSGIKSSIGLEKTGEKTKDFTMLKD